MSRGEGGGSIVKRLTSDLLTGRCLFGLGSSPTHVFRSYPHIFTFYHKFHLIFNLFT